MKIANTTLLALLGGASALSMNPNSNTVVAEAHDLAQTGAMAEERKRKRKHKKAKKSKKARRRRSHSSSCSSSKSKSSCSCKSTDDHCDVIMAHGYKDIYASSTLDIPFSYTKGIQ
jgi:hypothetical protein